MTRRPPTLAEAQRIETIVREVEVSYKPESFAWHDHKREAYALLKAMGYPRPSKSCFSCWVGALNNLRTSIGLDPFDHGTTAERAAFRMDVCTTCPAYHPSTQSCGRLVLDAINPQPVTIDGEQVNPCGCYLPLKVYLKHATCPASKWT